MPFQLISPVRDSGSRHISFTLAFAAGCLALGLNSCRTMGPGTIPPDGFNYNQRIADQENEQMLLNIVRLRYLEIPRFLNVASVISQYSRDASVGASGDFNTVRSLRANAGAGWADRPTITYTPMSGQAFAQSLLTPLPPAVVFFLIQSGWSAERLMRLTNSMINGLHNELGTPGERRQEDDEFKELLEVLHKLQRDGALGMHFNGDWPKVDVDIVLPEHPRTDSIRRDVNRFREILKLDPDQHVFDIEYGVIQEEPNHIMVQTHSILEMLSNISWYIEVPGEHVADGRTYSTFVPDDPDLIHIRSSRDRPGDAFLSIKYRGYWYYIEDRDAKSKNTFSVMQILMSMANDGSGSVGPLISIGN